MSRLAGWVAAATLLVVALPVSGCGKEPMSSDVKVADPYNGLKGQERVDAIRKDPKLNSMDRAQQIADAQKAAGLPVTGS